MVETQGRILRGPRMDLSLPDVSLGKHVFSNMLKHGDKIAQVYPSEQWLRLTYRELSSRAARVAAELSALGVGPGDVVALGCRPVSQFAALLLGVLLRNAVPAPFNPDLDPEEVELVVHQMLRPKLVVSQEPALSAVRGGGRGCPALSLSQVDDWLRSGGDAEAALRTLSPPDAAGWMDSCAAILCSSGTTGPPKGIVISHRALLTVCALSSMARKRAASGSQQRPDGMVSTSPVFWVSGLVMGLVGLSSAVVTCVLPRFDDAAIARFCGEYDVNDVFMPPNLAVTVAKNPDSPFRQILPQLKTLIVAGAAFGADMQHFVEKELGVPVKQWYGLTECINVLGTAPNEKPPAGSSGKLLFNVEAKVLDLETQEPVGPDQEGELCVRSPIGSRRYWNNPEATAAAWTADGWFHTGDVVRYDRDGYFYIVDRVKQLVKYRGIHVLTPQLETLLMSHPSVQLAAVVGTPHPTDQEHPTAFVVLRPGASVTPEELQKLVDEKVADHNKLRGGVRIVGELPHTATGKVAKRVLRQWAATAPAGRQ